MQIAWRVFAGVAGALHVLFFLLESLLLAQPRVQERFRLEGPEHYEHVRLWAFNQGFYNLFLALGVFAGLLLLRRSPARAETLALFPCACMVGAGLVLAGSDPRLISAACVQALPPALALGLYAVSRRQAAASAPAA